MRGKIKYKLQMWLWLAFSATLGISLMIYIGISTGIYHFGP